MKTEVLTVILKFWKQCLVSHSPVRILVHPFHVFGPVSSSTDQGETVIRLISGKPLGITFSSFCSIFGESEHSEIQGCQDIFKLDVLTSLNLFVFGVPGNLSINSILNFSVWYNIVMPQTFLLRKK